MAIMILISVLLFIVIITLGFFGIYFLDQYLECKRKNLSVSVVYLSGVFLCGFGVLFFLFLLFMQIL